VQDRAWSSPVWYTPTARARTAAGAGITVAELEKQGAVQLGDAQLTKTIVGKTVRVRNTVTGQEFEILYGAGGQRLVTSANGKALEPSAVGLLTSLAQAPYEIKDGQIVTHIGGEPFEIAVYQLGSEYRAARSDEYGFANYEVTF
jgi:hypothetical protein